ncbi:MAG: 7-carboxy-7-deazaguanine synthase QueE [Porticoccaceae bacterium]|jgi:7-carboxy-7-deazaguanine synthase
MSAETVKITEIFYSLQGETSTVGLPTVFVRLTGCPLRCVYCDTEYAFYGGQRMALTEVVAEVKKLNAPWVTVTGGEPLAQKGSHSLMKALCDEGYQVSLETSGALSIADVDSRVTIILDLKTPSSGEMARNLYENLPLLKAVDEVKFVVGDRQDYEWSRMKVDEYALLDKVGNVLFSPVFSKLSASDLADWIVADRLAVRMQLQLHKILWNDEPGR